MTGNFRVPLPTTTNNEPVSNLGTWRRVLYEMVETRKDKQKPLLALGQGLQVMQGAGFGTEAICAIRTQVICAIWLHNFERLRLLLAAI